MDSKVEIRYLRWRVLQWRRIFAIVSQSDVLNETIGPSDEQPRCVARIEGNITWDLAYGDIDRTNNLALVRIKEDYSGDFI
jgi:hypothetical protein